MNTNIRQVISFDLWWNFQWVEINPHKCIHFISLWIRKSLSFAGKMWCYRKGSVSLFIWFMCGVFRQYWQSLRSHSIQLNRLPNDGVLVLERKRAFWNRAKVWTHCPISPRFVSVQLTNRFRWKSIETFIFLSSALHNMGNKCAIVRIDGTENSSIATWTQSNVEKRELSPSTQAKQGQGKVYFQIESTERFSKLTNFSLNAFCSFSLSFP